MSLEDKFDEDFLFYLGFTSSFINKVKTPEDKELCKEWLRRLIGEKCYKLGQKRIRNIFLCNLVLCMQDGKMSLPFTLNPHEVQFSEVSKYFGSQKFEVQQPDWFDDVIGGGGGDISTEAVAEAPGQQGRTYVATRAMPHGEGAFAYVAINMAEDEPKWLGGGEGAFDMKMQEKFAEYCPPPTEMERILARRKDPKEREKVLTFYDVLMKNISDEMDDKIPTGESDTVNGLIEQLCNDIKQKGEWAPYENMTEAQRRQELLLMLFDRIHARREKIAKRESVLDDIEESIMPKSFFETSVLPDDKMELPSAMWEQAINKAPTKKHMEVLQESYPLGVLEKFLELLSDYKEELACRLQKRHEHIVAQMRKELRKEGEKGLKKMEEAQSSCDQAQILLKNVKAAYNQQLESEKAIQPRKKGGITTKTRLYEEMRQAIFDTQRGVEDEAARGRMLSEQINAVNEQTEIYQQVNEDSIMRTEEENMAIMKNIKRLSMAVKQYETRLTQLQAMQQSRRQSAAASSYMMF